jgi:two-component system, chemotaxis family, chemotaxis protein CheY
MLKRIFMERINIIVVEDQREVLHAITKDLTALEDFLTVEECESAAEAMDVMESIEAEGNHVALVISDHVMPEKTGVDFLADVHRDERFKGTRKILLTGLATHSDTINAINKAAIDRYISKPWKSEQLLSTVKTLLTEYIMEKGIAYEPYLGWLDKEVVFDRLRRSTL